jgi:EAL domain-containing protein (putative c-di-GMP-specific phosphodiesterase class I)
MRRACGDFSRWRSHGVGQHATLRLNISPTQLATNGLAESVADTIAEFAIDASSVCLEIRERVMGRDIQNAHTTLAKLKDIGVQIAIDDFGTGDVVLSQLKSLPVDMLKINTGFIRELGTSAADLAVVRAIVGLAEGAGLQLSAEGVETSIAATTLLRHGCNRAQGFLLSRPVTGDVMELLLSRRRIPLPFNPSDEPVAPFAIEDLTEADARLASVSAAS